MLAVFILVILDSQSDNSKVSAVYESGSDALSLQTVCLSAYSVFLLLKATRCIGLKKTEVNTALLSSDMFI